MESPSNRRAMRQFGLAVVLALAGCLLAARPAAAQVYWVAPDRSIVNVGPQQPAYFYGTYNFTPVVMPGNQYVRLNGYYSFTLVNPAYGYPGTGFVQPFYANDRALGANFYGARNYNPRPVFTGPWQKWW
jgi:hypothetical protein